MRKVKFFNKYPTPITILTEKNIEVHIDEFNMNLPASGTTRILMLEEPLRGPIYTLAKNHPEYYHILLTYQDELLRTNPKARLFRCADTGVHGYEPIKKFCVSTVVGGKTDDRMSGYKLRHDVWRNRDKITTPKEFYLSKNYWWHEVDYNGELILGDSKGPLFDSMFHISIENTSIKHYFSEKLLDCFQTRTVPIYCGCTNIGDYFNINGIIVVNTVEDIIRECNRLTPELYESMLPAMEENYNLSQSRVDYLTQLKVKITEIVKEIEANGI
jgi:hypothetical protein